MHVCIGPVNDVRTMATTVVTDTNRTTVTDQITVHVPGKLFRRACSFVRVSITRSI